MSEIEIKWPFWCRLCRLGVLKKYCIVCPPVSVEKNLTAEELRAVRVQRRYNAEAESIVSEISPETRKYYADFNKRLKKEKRRNKVKNLLKNFGKKSKGAKSEHN